MKKTSVPVPKPNEALNSKCLQSPDDIEATYRKKKGKQYQGYVAMVTETCHPDNDLQLITDVHTATNNTDDTQLLHKRLDSIKEKTPDLEQLHHDGGFGSEDNDIKLNELGITPIQTAIKGCCASSPITITLQSDTNTYRVQCANSQHPQVIATKPSKNYKAEFDLHICNLCPFRDTCPTKTNRKYEKGVAIYKFKPEDYLRQQRHKNIQKIPKAHQKLRPNVEATMAQMRRGENRNGKLKVRGLINTSLYSIAMAIVINFSRIVKRKKRITNSINLFSMIHALYSPIKRIAPFITPKHSTSTKYYINEIIPVNPKSKGAFFSVLLVTEVISFLFNL